MSGGVNVCMSLLSCDVCCSLTVIMSKYQQGQILQSLCHLIVWTTVLPSSMSNKHQSSGMRKEKKILICKRKKTYK